MRIIEPPMTQLSSRGLRNAPVKKIRNMCTIIDGDEEQRRPVVDLAHAAGRRGRRS